MHIAGMVALRKLAYAVGGATYVFHLSFAEILYEARKDLFSFLTIGITFWLAERALGPAGHTLLRADASATTRDAVPQPQANKRF